MARKERRDITPPGRPQRTEAQEQDFSYLLHGELAAGSVYEVLSKSLIKNDVFGVRAISYARDVVKRMKPRDPLERMLVQQALWTHARLARLSTLAVSQTSLEGCRILNEACDRAANAFRRLMLALAEYRHPLRCEQLSIQQTNLAGQQVVQQIIGVENQGKSASNELGTALHEAADHKETIPPKL